MTDGALNDHELAALLANETGQLLVTLRDEMVAAGSNLWQLRDQGDRQAHNYLMEQLALHRPDDAVLSEEGTDNPERLTAERTWIIDPLDGTHDYGNPRSGEFAVHVALVEDGRPTAAAVSCPVLELDFNTGITPIQEKPDRDHLVLVSSRSNVSWAADAARALDADLVACGSCGVKAMLAVSRQVDVYVHASGLYEWDVCAPAAVAEAFGFDVLRMDGTPHTYNKSRPVCEGLVICPPEHTATVLDALRW